MDHSIWAYSATSLLFLYEIESNREGLTSHWELCRSHTLFFYYFSPLRWYGNFKGMSHIRFLFHSHLYLGLFHLSLYSIMFSSECVIQCLYWCLYFLPILLTIFFSLLYIPDLIAFRKLFNFWKLSFDSVIYKIRRVALWVKTSTINDATCIIICYEAYLGLLLIKELSIMGRFSRPTWDLY